MIDTGLICNNSTPEGICHGSLALTSSDMLPLIEIGDRVQYGLLGCKNCRAVFPIIDFIPVLIQKPFSYLRDNFSIIDTYLKFVGRPLPAVIRKSLYTKFLELIRKPDEPVIVNRKGYEARFMENVSSRFWAYYESYLGKEWEKDLFSLGRLDNRQLSGLLEEINMLIGKYRSDSHINAIDIGANLGGYTFILARYFTRAFGLDTSFESMHTAGISSRNRNISFFHKTRGKSINQELNFLNEPRFIVSQAELMPFNNEIFDFSLCLNIVDVVADPSTMLAETARVMKKDGITILTTPFIESGKSVGKMLDFGNDEISGLKTITKKLGFSILEEKDNILWRLNEYPRKIILYNLFLMVLQKN